MRTLFLVNPPERPGYSHERSLSGGLGVARKLKFGEKAGLYLPPPDMMLAAAVGEQSGLKVEIIDLLLEGGQGEAAIQHTLDRISKAAGTGNEVWIGVRLSIPTLPRELAFSNALKERMPEARLFLFGAVIMTTVDHWSRETKADALIYGEPEAVLGGMFEAAATGSGDWKRARGVLDPKTYVPAQGDNLWDGSQQKQFNKWTKVQDLADVPYSAYHLLPLERYSPTGKTEDIAVYVTASRGCPIGCTMCPYMLHEGRPLRKSGAERVVDELEWLNKNWGIFRVRFRDPNFGFDRKLTREILEGVIARGIKLAATVEGSLEVMEDDLIALMAKAGIKTITTGIETADAECLESIGQKIKINDILARKITYADSLGIHVYGTFVVGAPEESWDTVERTIVYSKQVPCESAFTVMTPFPGTPMYYRALEEGLLDRGMKYEQWNSYEATVRSRFLTKEDLQLARLWARLELIIPYRLEQARRRGDIKELVRAHAKLIPHQIALRLVRAQVALRKRRGSPPVRVPEAVAARRIQKIPLTAKD